MTTVRGRVVTPYADLPDAVVEIDGTRISAVREASAEDSLPPSDVLIVPGLVDQHCHGGGGASFTSGDRQQAETAAIHHLRNGTTSVVAGVVTDAPDRMVAVTATLADAVDEGTLAGIHIEGPFLSAARCGAQDPQWLTAPDLGLAREILEAGRGHVRMMTIAPELPGADEVADLVRAYGARVAVGHTEAPADVVDAFLRRHEPSVVTHLFNGMPPLHHRTPGPVLGSLRAAGAGVAVVELVADGVHLDDQTVAGVFELVGADRVALVTDAMAAAGMADGSYQLGPQQVTVVDGVARLAGGDSIAGGTARLIDVVRRQVAAGLPLVDVVAAASVVPARAMGLGDVGVLDAGHRADLVVLDPGLHVVGVMRGGAWAR